MLWINKRVRRLRKVGHEVFFERNLHVGKTFFQQLTIVIAKGIGDESDTHQFVAKFVQILIEC